MTHLEIRIEELEMRVWDAHLREKNLKYQIKQRDEIIKKAHSLLIQEPKNLKNTLL